MAISTSSDGKRSGSLIPGAGPLFGALVVATLVFLTLIVFAAEPSHVVFVRVGPTSIGLFIADSEGNNERPLLPATSLDYNASFSSDGRWIVFTSERGGSADIYSGSC